LRVSFRSPADPTRRAAIVRLQSEGINYYQAMPQTTVDSTQSVPWYVVLSVEKDQALEATGHSHVVGLSTRDPDGGETRWTLVQVIAAIRDGERFVVGRDTDERAAVMEPAICPQCPMSTLVVETPAATV
jgi:hypothetical protein